ncbi:hydrogenase expression protein HupH [Rhodanobacter sp. FW510-R12]|uniref:aspartate/glutamate racemase family protein n=1 Tax=Rhodanobacter TaxID=75309 RepID=UPI000424EB3E|nr:MULTISPECIES: aspartate/glutamate racemase family protein [Rhodanobacter]UJJ54519.1 aspartate/glutamate racemase family protein [Rhodanobacter thiooxydans]
MVQRIKIIVPIPMGAEGVAARASQLPPRLVLPGFEPEFVSVAKGAALGDSAYDSLLMDFSVVEAGLRAQEEGYAAVCIDTVSDSGLDALRSRLDIPVIAPGAAAFHVACMLGKKFTVLTMWDEWFALYEKTLTAYHLWPRVASLRSINTRPDLEELLAGKEEVVFQKLEDAARKAIKEDGADVIVLGSTTMHQSHTYLSERLPVPVINPGQVAWKLCEMFLTLGLRHSRKAYPAPQAPNDAVYHGFAN